MLGLRLSDRVWNYSNQFKEEIEWGLDLGIRGGLSADEMARELKQYLRFPDKLFRRVKDEHGDLVLSKNAAAFHPGRGVYRSSYKNARRLAATETNIAYRTADYLRWQDLDFVVGIEIHLSQTNHPVPDICDDLKGKYPKDFKFTRWHPHCRCYATSVLKTKEEIIEDNKRILNGEQPTEDSVNTVSDVPHGFKDWVADNRERIERAQSLPYFLKDNNGYLKQTLSEISNSKAQATDKLQVLQSVYDKVVLRGTQDDFNNGISSKFDFIGVREKINSLCKDMGMELDNWVVVVNGKDNFLITARDSKNYSFSITRTFMGGGDSIEVHHDYFSIDKAFQSKGLSKDVFRVFYEQYKRIGVRYITVEANIDVGGYTWARYGFMAVDKNAALKAWEFSGHYAHEVEKAKDFIEAYYKKNNLPSSSPFPMKLFTEGEWKEKGKRILCGTDWNGKIDLSDTAQRKTFENYLGV